VKIENIVEELGNLPRSGQLGEGTESSENSEDNVVLEFLKEEASSSNFEIKTSDHFLVDTDSETIKSEFSSTEDPEVVFEFEIPNSQRKTYFSHIPQQDFVTGYQRPDGVVDLSDSSVEELSIDEDSDCEILCDSDINCMGRKTKNRRSMDKVEKMEVDEPFGWEAELNNEPQEPELISQTMETNKKKNKSRKSRKAAKAVADVEPVDVIDLTNDEEINLDEEAATPDNDVVKPGQVEIQIDEDGDGMPELIEVVPVAPEELAENWRQKGNARFGNGEYHHALEMYTKAIAIHPVEAAYYGNRSACYLMMKKYKEALADARIAIQTDPNFEKGYLRLVRAALALGDVKACEGAIEGVDRNRLSFTLDINPEKIKLLQLKQLFNEITVAKSKKDHRKAVYLCERTSEIASGNIQLKMWKASALSSLGRHSEAQELCTEALQSDSKSVEAIYMYSVCLYQADTLERAVQFLRQSLQLAPDNPDCLSLYRKVKQLKDLREEAGIMFTSGKYSEAKINYLNCLEIVKAPDLTNITIQSKLHFNLALIAQKKGDLDESLNSCKLAIELNPSYLKAVLHQAKIHTQKEMFEEAVRDYEAALKIDPKLKDIRRSLQEAKLSAKKAKRKDYYKILNIGKQATEDEIRKAYKKRALVHHPDRHAGATETVRSENEKQFKDVGEAYEVLSDPKKRVRYDQGHDLIDSPSADSYDSFDPNTLFNVFFSQGGMGMGGGGGGGAPRGGGFHHFRTGPSYSGFQR